MIRKGIIENVPAKRTKTPKFVPAGQSTQLIVGASPETDYSIVNLSEALYIRAGLKRVYYSAYIPVREESSILPVTPPQLRRENRLYQADWLLRFYKYSASEILDEKHPFLDLEIDPKSAWAVRNYYFFPVDVNRADYESLLRVPGIGVLSARKIIQARRAGSLTPESLKKIGVVMKRAKYFITCSGKPAAQIIDQPERVRLILADSNPRNDSSQLLLFQDQVLLPDRESFVSAITGDI
jgi:predicted DNA-binding helix-hairpin-helix protein